MEVPSYPRLADIDLTLALAGKAEYEDRLHDLQRKLLTIQQTYFQQRRRALLLFEGRDAAGKGGAIRRLSERLDPRSIRVYPIGPPMRSEQGRHYLYRFWRRLPRPGFMTVFDRSWYGRVLVERVQGLATQHEWMRAYDEINQFEKMLTDDGVRLVKIFMHINSDEQLKRFRERIENPFKRWKISREDLRNRVLWDDYTAAYDTMFERTSTQQAPWHVVAGNAKWYARVRVLQIATDELSRNIELLKPYNETELAEVEAEVRKLLARN